MIPSWMPQIGMKFKCTTEALDFWTSYGGHIGFDVSKNYGNKSKLMGWSLLQHMFAQMRVIEQKTKEIIKHDVLVRKQELVAK
jgi:hypothetical protein